MKVRLIENIASHRRPETARSLSMRDFKRPARAVRSRRRDSDPSNSDARRASLARQRCANDPVLNEVWRLTVLKHPGLGGFDEIAIGRRTADRIENDRVCVDQLAFAVSLDHALHSNSDCIGRLYHQNANGFCGKQGQPRTALDYQRFVLWQKVRATIWLLGFPAGMLLRWSLLQK